MIAAGAVSGKGLGRANPCNRPSRPRGRRIQNMDRQDGQDFVCRYRTVVDGPYRSIQIQKSCLSCLSMLIKKLPRKCLDLPRNRVYTDQESKPPNPIREEIAMSLRNAVVAFAFLMAFFAGGGVSIGPSPGHPLGLFRLASLCPRGSPYRHPGIPGRKPGQDPLLRH